MSSLPARRHGSCRPASTVFVQKEEKGTLVIVQRVNCAGSSILEPSVLMVVYFGALLIGCFHLLVYFEAMFERPCECFCSLREKMQVM